MNPYGDPNSVRGRAQVPGLAGAPGPDDDAPFPPHRGGGGPVGGAPAGSAPVRPRGTSPAAGSARVGRAGVPQAGAEAGGYASARTGAGRPTVGRAVVRPVSPAGPGEAGPELGRPIRGAKQPASKRAKRRRRANWLIGSLAVLVILAGASVMAFTYYFDDIPAAEFNEVETTTLAFADGKQLAKLGDQNRTLVPWGQISPVVRNAVMAAEDKGFMEHSGIDLKGIARAAWNNFSGGSTQGASTITQQYARHAADLNQISVSRKVREALLSRKIESEKSKLEILGLYLNAIYFGRGAHGIEAAAQVYFGKSAIIQPGQRNALTPEEAAVLASVIKQPEPDKLTGHNGYDPQVNPTAAQERWAYTMGNMLEMGWITPEQHKAAKYPAVKKFNPKACQTRCNGKTPIGNVINRVKEELTTMGINTDSGGYRITTTINPKAQAAAENAARQASAESPMNKLSPDYQAALVAVDPNNGRVLAYYGGDDGTGTDYAHYNEEEGGGRTGGHPPGSTFKVYTLAAALQDNVAFESYWDATKKKKDGNAINNAERNNLACKKSCQLKEATVKSYNFAFYWIADELGPDKVVEAAKAAGVRSIWNNEDKYFDLNKQEPEGMSPEVGFGQFKVTVLDHANGMATLAGRGKYNKAHFVRTVEKKNLATGKWEKVGGEQLRPTQVFDADKMDNLNGVLQEIPGANGKTLKSSRPASAKTGTWELNQTSKENGDAWMIGATPQIASAVWVGSKKDRKPLKERDGSKMGGGKTPGAIWKQFMDDVHEVLDLPEEKFPERKITGDPKHEAANGVAPPEKPITGNPFCAIPDPIRRLELCPEGQQGGNNNNPGTPGPGLIPDLGGGNNQNGNNQNNNGGNANPGNGNNNGGVRSPFDRNRFLTTPPPG